MVTMTCSGLAHKPLQRLGCSVPYPGMLLWIQSPWINCISPQQNLNCMISLPVSPIRSVPLIPTTFLCTCFDKAVSQGRLLFSRIKREKIPGATETLPRGERRSSRRLHVCWAGQCLSQWGQCTGAQSGDCIVQHSRARREDFPSSIFLKKDFIAAKQSTIKHPDYPGSLFLHWWMRDLFALVCLTTAPPFWEQRGKNSSYHNECRFGVPPTDLTWPFSTSAWSAARGVALPVPWGGDISAVTKVTCAALCAGHCSAHPAADTWTQL